MEIVSGKARGVTLRPLPADAAIRPTSVRARTALFDSLSSRTVRVFADVFSGSGAMGLEAASRGAEKVIFIDSSAKSLNVAKSNAAAVGKAGVDAEYLFIRAAVPSFAERRITLPVPDVIFADPPYAESMKLLSSLAGMENFRIWAQASLLIWELPPCVDLEPVDGWKIEGVRLFGSGRFLLLSPK